MDKLFNIVLLIIIFVPVIYFIAGIIQWIKKENFNGKDFKATLGGMFIIISIIGIGFLEGWGLLIFIVGVIMIIKSNNYGD